MEYLLATNPWIGMILWSVIYFSDYRMTIIAARKYAANQHVAFEGSAELTPQFEKDVNALKPVSKRHLLLLVFTNLLLLVFWELFSLLHFTRGFLFLLGMLLLMEVAIHLRHFRTLHLLTQNESRGGLEGKLSYRRWLLFSTSAFEFLQYAVLFVLTAILTNSIFFLGGAFSCLSIAYNHQRRSRALFKQAAPPA